MGLHIKNFQNFGSEKILATVGKKMGRFAVKKLSQYLVFSSHYIPFRMIWLKGFISLMKMTKLGLQNLHVPKSD